MAFGTHSMRITIELYGVFRINRFKRKVCDYPAPLTVAALVEELGLPSSLLGTVVVNGRHADPGRELSDGDTVSLLPFLDGG